MKFVRKAVCCILSVLMVLGSTACSNTKEAKMEGELTISVYKSEEWLETAAKLFEDKYPGVTVSIHSFYDAGSELDIYTDGGLDSGSSIPTGQTREDYLAELNTKILSKEAEDLMLTSSGMPVERYIAMGVFEDLSGYLEESEEINEGNYYMNIFDACRWEDGGLYQFPLAAMAVPLMTFETELMENTGVCPPEGTTRLTWREGLDLAKEMYEKSTLDNTYMPDMRTTVGNVFTKEAIAGINYADGTVELDREKIMEILQVFVEMADYKTRPKNASQAGHTCFSIGYHPDDEAAYRMLFLKDTKAYQWENQDGKVYLCPYYALDFGINSASEQKELAWEFLKFLASDEIQTLPSFPWAGVNRNGLAARIAGSMKADGVYDSEEEIQAVTELIESWILEINAYRTEDAELINLTEGELNLFLEGKTSALETIDNLERKLEQYVNE